MQSSVAVHDEPPQNMHRFFKDVHEIVILSKARNLVTTRNVRSSIYHMYTYSLDFKDAGELRKAGGGYVHLILTTVKGEGEGSSTCYECRSVI